MHALKLNIHDNVFDKIIYFLKNLPKDEVSIVEDKILNESQVQLIEENSEEQLFSNHTANLVEEWKDISEDDVWK
ncbi:MAG: hypothetical protein GQ570_01675 [Helicobacteraceae bacterium]|nr:hypothetical protein [Helicobacteraceae bacterium]